MTTSVGGSVAAVVATLGLTACAGGGAVPGPGATENPSDIVEFLVSCKHRSDDLGATARHRLTRLP